MDTAASVELHSGQARATVSLRGAQALRWSIAGRDLLWTPDPAFWHEVSPLLFPVVGWTQGGQARVGARHYPLSLHGFARHLDYTVVAQGNDHVQLAIADTALTRALYPFAFELLVDYHLAPQALTMAMTVRNRGAAPMPYACGFHPGFAWPFAGGRQEDYAIVFDSKETGEVPVIAPGGLIGTARRNVPVAGRRLALTASLFATDALCFLNPASRSLQFAGPQGTITMRPQNLPHMALWMRPGGQYLCLEAWSGYSDPEGFVGELAEKPSISLLPAEASARHAVVYEFAG